MCSGVDIMCQACLIFLLVLVLHCSPTVSLVCRAALRLCWSDGNKWCGLSTNPHSPISHVDSIYCTAIAVKYVEITWEIPGTSNSASPTFVRFTYIKLMFHYHNKISRQVCFCTYFVAWIWAKHRKFQLLPILLHLLLLEIHHTRNPPVTKSMPVHLNFPLIPGCELWC